MTTDLKSLGISIIKEAMLNFLAVLWYEWLGCNPINPLITLSRGHDPHAICRWPSCHMSIFVVWTFQKLCYFLLRLISLDLQSKAYSRSRRMIFSETWGHSQSRYPKEGKSINMNQELQEMLQVDGRKLSHDAGTFLALCLEAYGYLKNVARGWI